MIFDLGYASTLFYDFCCIQSSYLSVYLQPSAILIKSIFTIAFPSTGSNKRIHLVSRNFFEFSGPTDCMVLGHRRGKLKLGSNKRSDGVRTICVFTSFVYKIRNKRYKIYLWACESNYTALLSVWYVGSTKYLFVWRITSVLMLMCILVWTVFLLWVVITN